MRDQNGRSLLDHRVSVDHALTHVAPGWYLIHYVQEDFLDDSAEPAGTRLVPLRQARGRVQRIRGKDELDLIECEEALILLGDRVLGLGKNAHQVAVTQGVQAHDAGQTPYKLRDQPKLEEVIVG